MSGPNNVSTVGIDDDDCDVLNGLVDDPLYCHCSVCVLFRPYKLRPSTTRTARAYIRDGWTPEYVTDSLSRIAQHPLKP